MLSLKILIPFKKKIYPQPNTFARREYRGKIYANNIRKN